MFDETSKRPLLDEYYQRFLQSEDSADFIFGVSQHYSLASLELLARSGQRITRRASILALGFLGDYSVNHVLGQSLTDNDRGVRLLADHGIRQLWFRIGKPNLEIGLRQIVRLNRQHRFACATDLSSDLIKINPDIAEAWNQRAISSYNLEDYWQAIEDCRRALELNPWHFLAALGSANCHLELGNVYEALNDFRLSLEINPDLEMVRSQIDQLQRIVEG